MNKYVIAVLVVAFLIVGAVFYVYIDEASYYPRGIRFLQPEPGMQIKTDSAEGVVNVVIEAHGMGNRVDLGSTFVRLEINGSLYPERIAYAGMEGEGAIYRGTVPMTALAKYGSNEFVARLTIRYPSEFIFQPSERTFTCGSLLNWKKPSEIETLLGIDLESPTTFAAGFFILAIVTLLSTKGNTLVAGIVLFLGAIIVGYYFKNGFLVCLAAGAMGVLLMVGSILANLRIVHARNSRTGVTVTQVTGSEVTAAETSGQITQPEMLGLQQQMRQLQSQLDRSALTEGRER